MSIFGGELTKLNLFLYAVITELVTRRRKLSRIHNLLIGLNLVAAAWLLLQTLHHLIVVRTEGRRNSDVEHRTLDVKLVRLTVPV